MSDIDIRVVTKIDDPSGMNALTRWLADTEARVNRIAKTMSGMSVGAFSNSSQASVGAISGPPPRRPMQTGSNGPSYDLNTQSGLYSWEVNVEKPVQQMAQAARQTAAASSSARRSQNSNGFRNSFQNAFFQRMAPSTVPWGQSTQQTVNGAEIRNWFDSLFGQMNYSNPSVDNSVVTAYDNARHAAKTSKDTLPSSIRQFYEQFGGQLGGPAAQTAPAGGGGGGLGSGAGTFLGLLGRRALPALTVGEAAKYTFDQFSQGFQSWQQSSAPVDRLAHSMGNAAKDVEKFRNQISYAGAQFGLSMQQSAQMATSFMQSMGNLSQAQTVSLVHSTAQWAQQNGLSSTQASQLTSTAARLGLTSGKGASMTNSQFQNLITNSALQGHMTGRQGEVGTAFLDVTNQVASMNPIVPNQKGIAGMLTAMGATNIQGLQGMRGAAVLSQLNGSVMNPNSYQQAILFAAMTKARGGSTPQLLQAIQAYQGGVANLVPGTNETIGAALKQYAKSQGNMQTVLMSSFFGGNLNEAQAILGVKNFGKLSVSTKGTQHPWYSAFDNWMRTAAKYAVGQSDLGWYMQPFASASKAFGPWGGIALATATAGTFLRGGMGLGNAGGGGIFSGIRSLFGEGSATKLLGGTTRLGTLADTSTLSSLSSLTDLIPLIGAPILTQLGMSSLLHMNANASVKKTGNPTVDYLHSIRGLGWLANFFGGSNSATSTAQHIMQHQTHTAQVQSKLPSSSSNTIRNMTISNLTISHLNLPHSSSFGSSLPVSSSNIFAPSAGADGGANFGALGFLGSLGMRINNWITGGSAGASNASIAGGPGGVSNYTSVINAAAKKFGVPANIIGAVMSVESGGHQYSASGNILTSSAGALGIMQLEPGTAKSLGENPYNTNQNIMGGAKYLAEMYKEFGSWTSAIQAYNGGPGNVGSSATLAYLQKVESAEKQITIHPSTVQAIGNAVATAIKKNQVGARSWPGGPITP